MQQKNSIDLEDARRIAAAAEQEAASNGWQVAIAIVDNGGHLLYLQRDQVQLGSIEVAITKARSALGFRRPTLHWQDVIDTGKPSYLGLTGAFPVEGGVPLEYEGAVVGAIGVSGVRANQDAMVARAGAAAL